MKTILCFLLILVCSLTVFPQASLAQDFRPMVRLIYFLPNDRKPQPDIDAKIDGLIKGVQQFYANQMAAHGFGRKTFQFETDVRGNAVVHRVRGRFTDKHYINLSDTWDILKEIEWRFDPSKNICFTVIDISSERIVSGGNEVCGLGGSFPGVGRFALIPASGLCFDLVLAAHELGHAFRLEHDTRDERYVMDMVQVLGQEHEFSACATEMLNVHPAFNLAQPVLDTEETISEIFPPSFAFAPNAIRLRFKVSDPDGLYQAQALVDGDESLELLGCKQLNGNTHSTFEIITTSLLPKHKQTTIHLRVIDMQGNIYNSEPYPINVIDLLPPAKVVAIPDEKLAAAVRETLKLAPGTALTTDMMLNLAYLDITTGGIKDLTGLEHAHRLKELRLYNNQISDVSPLAGLTRLRSLWLSENNVSDVSALAGLTQLEELLLGSNNISDVSPLAGLTHLRSLWLHWNNISDVSPLAGLTQLEDLRLHLNPLSYASINTHIPAIQAKGIVVSVAIANRAHSALLKISGDAQEGAAGTALPTSFVVEVMDEKGKPMRGVSVTFAVTAGDGRLSHRIVTTDASGRARTTLTLGQRSQRNTVRATAEGIRSFAIFNATVTPEPTRLIADVNGDGAINIQDLVFVASRLGQAGENPADVNGDGFVNIQDLVFVAGELGGDAAAPAAWHHTSLGVPTPATVEEWLIQARGLPLTDARSQRGVLLLERFFAALAPEETALLSNYPNPFNPETWIPYHLAKPADVT